MWEAISRSSLTFLNPSQSSQFKEKKTNTKQPETQASLTSLSKIESFSRIRQNKVLKKKDSDYSLEKIKQNNQISHQNSNPSQIRADSKLHIQDQLYESDVQQNQMKLFGLIEVKPFNLHPKKQNPNSEQRISQPEQSILCQKSQAQSLEQIKFGAHTLIKLILQKNKKKVIQHNINKINPQTVLYKKIKRINLSDLYGSNLQGSNLKAPNLQTRKNRYNIDSAKFLNKNNEQEIVQLQNSLQQQNKCGKKLNQVYKKIKEEFRILDEIKKESQAYEQCKSMKKNSFSMRKNEKNKPSNSASQKTIDSNKTLEDNPQQGQITTNQQKPYHQKILNVSGLATYKFKSLKAQKNLINNHYRNCSHDQQLQKQQENIKFKSKCPLHRMNKIQYRSVTGLKKQMKQKQIALRQSLVKLQYSNLKTQDYLKKVIENKKKVSRIYGEEQNRLEYINYLMNHQQWPRPLAQFSVDLIVQKVKTQADSAEQTYQSIENSKRNTIDDEILLSQRKKICYKSKLQVSTKKQMNENSKNYLRISKYVQKSSSGILLNHLTFVNDFD